eukprot:5360697-Heterocapsa_arctica.AAC.1
MMIDVGMPDHFLKTDDNNNDTCGYGKKIEEADANHWSISDDDKPEQHTLSRAFQQHKDQRATFRSPTRNLSDKQHLNKRHFGRTITQNKQT